MLRWLLLLGVLALPGFAEDPFEASRCPTLFRSLGQGRLTDEAVDQVLRGDETYPQVADMGANALSYLAAAEHLSPGEKVELWERFALRIPRLSGRRFTVVLQDVADETVRAYMGHRGEVVAIDVRTGQLYRGRYDEYLPETWTLAQGIADKRMHPLGNPSKVR